MSEIKNEIYSSQMNQFESYRYGKPVGGTEYIFNKYYINAFTEPSGTFFVYTPTLADVFIVAGGGHGGIEGGAGAGAGGIIFKSILLSTGEYEVIVGHGGAPGHPQSDSNSSFYGNIAIAGGVGNQYGTWLPSSNGGSGGGGHESAVPGQGIPGQGYDGGVGRAGGGSSSPGTNVGGTGTDMSTYFGTTVGDDGWFASGGGSAGSVGTPPKGGGGMGDENGMASTGGGGGGSPGINYTAGGSGIVLIRYQNIY